MSYEIHIAPAGQGLVYVLMRDAKCEDILFTDSDGKRDIGAIYMAKVDRAVKGSGGMFVDIGGEKAFLRSKKNYPLGRTLPVQIQQCASHDKPIRVSDQIDYRGEFVVLTPGRPGVHQSRKIRSVELLDEAQSQLASLLPEDCGMIVRSASRNAGFDEIAEDAAALLEQLNNVENAKSNAGIISAAPIGARRALVEWSDNGVYEHEYFPDYILEALHNALNLPLKCAGGEVYIEATRALIAIDVNTGANTAPTAARDVNLSVASHLPRWLRMMGWGGQVCVDLAPMPVGARKTFETAIIKSAKKSGLSLNGHGFGPLGLYEATIKYDRRPLPRNILELLGN